MPMQTVPGLEPATRWTVEKLDTSAKRAAFLDKLPNRLSKSRIISALLMLVDGFILPSHDHRALGVWIAVAASLVFMITDSLDGSVARARGVVSVHGGELDAGFDVLTVFCFHAAWAYSAWKIDHTFGTVVIALVSVRLLVQLMIFKAGLADKKRNGSDSAGPDGKIKTFMDCTCIITTAFIGTAYPDAQVGMYCSVAAIVLTVGTLYFAAHAFVYHYNNARHGRSIS